MYVVSICGVDDLGERILSVTILNYQHPLDKIEGYVKVKVTLTLGSLYGFHLIHDFRAGCDDYYNMIHFLEKKAKGSCILCGLSDEAFIKFERKKQLTMEFSLGFMESNRKNKTPWLLNCSAKKVTVKDVQVAKSCNYS